MKEKMTTNELLLAASQQCLSVGGCEMLAARIPRLARKARALSWAKRWSPDVELKEILKRALEALAGQELADEAEAEIRNRGKEKDEYPEV